MSRSPGSESEARQLLGLVDLLRESVLTVTQQWEKERNSSVTEDSAQQTVPSPDLFEAQRRIEAIAGTLIALVAEPSHRIQQVMTLAVQARALILATEMKIPDKLTAAGKQGIHVSMLSERTGIESRKLGKFSPSGTDNWQRPCGGPLTSGILVYYSSPHANLVYHSHLQ